MASKIVSHAVEGGGVASETVAMPRTSRPKRKDARRPTFIREWRKHRGLTLESLAERLAALTQLEMSDGQLSRIERGEQPYTQDLLEALAIVLQCEPPDLIRRRPGDETGIQVDGLAPEQVALIEGMVQQMRKAG